jgi:hypothetical protein
LKKKLEIVGKTIDKENVLSENGAQLILEILFWIKVNSAHVQPKFLEKTVNAYLHLIKKHFPKYNLKQPTTEEESEYL